MFDWLRRRGAATASKPAQRPQEKSAPRRAPRDAAPSTFPPSMPLPEVVGEGNTQADWGAWEDSMTTLDSQMQDLVPSQRVYVRDARDTRPSQLEDDDPFSSVRGKRR